MKIHHTKPSRLIGAFIGAVAAISIALPATAGAAPVNEPVQFGASQTEHAPPASSSTPALRRDGSKAAPFVADLGPNAPAANGDFDWGDAAIGAGAITGIIVLGLGGALGARRLKASPHRHRMPAATSS